jgi:hypothetical protein
MDLLLASYNLLSTINFPTRLQNGSATAIDNIFIDASLHGNYAIYPLSNGLLDHDAQLFYQKSKLSRMGVQKESTEN